MNYGFLPEAGSRFHYRNSSTWLQRTSQCQTSCTHKKKKALPVKCKRCFFRDLGTRCCCCCWQGKCDWPWLVKWRRADWWVQLWHEGSWRLSGWRPTDFRDWWGRWSREGQRGGRSSRCNLFRVTAEVFINYSGPPYQLNMKISLWGEAEDAAIRDYHSLDQQQRKHRLWFDPLRLEMFGLEGVQDRNLTAAKHLISSPPEINCFYWTICLVWKLKLNSFSVLVQSTAAMISWFIDQQKLFW